eukprot:gene9462-10452_t
MSDRLFSYSALLLLLLVAFLQLADSFHSRTCSIRKALPTLRSQTASVDTFHEVSVQENAPEAEGLRRVTIAVPKEVSEAYSVAGQYVKLRPRSSSQPPSIYALASPPDGRDHFTFLIKDSPSNQFLQEHELEMSLPLGRGFPVQQAFESYKSDYPVTSVFLFATGSGIAPIAAAIESGTLRLGEISYTSLFPRKAVLFYGVQTPRHLALTSRFDQWRSSGVEVVPVFSREGAKQRVQDVLVQQERLRFPRNSGILLCGQKAMTDAIKQIALEAGVFEGRILLNY